MSTHTLNSRGGFRAIGVRGVPGKRRVPPGQHSSADEQRAATRREVMVP
ncbi:MAG TPA: hypothetical protein VK162_09495 [Streptosporangiaceae bacterium]|nr:hypothetical protein [Streptosporangiaceae bacterium]